MNRLSYIISTMAAVQWATQKAKASAVMILALISQNIPVVASEGSNRILIAMSTNVHIFYGVYAWPPYRQQVKTAAAHGLVLIKSENQNNNDYISFSMGPFC